VIFIEEGDGQAGVVRDDLDLGPDREPTVERRRGFGADQAVFL
jgi:hypothetical protein